MKHIAIKYKSLWREKSFLRDVFIGFILLVIGIFATYYANYYTVHHASNSVTDILLDNLPVVNLDIIYSGGAAIFITVVALLGLYEPRRISFMLKSSALFLIVRSLFMMLTHIASPANALYIHSNDLLHKISSGDDLFFSAHTGFPFLFSLIFWDEKPIRYLFMFTTFLGATSVILGHSHYSIDVFSAFFITYGIFVIARKAFSKDYKLFANHPR